jgi:hypothetical protein
MEVAGISLRATSDLSDVRAIVGNGSDTGRSVPLGDFPTGTTVSVRFPLSRSESITIIGSTDPGENIASSGEVDYNVVAYFGTPKGNQISDLDPTLFLMNPNVPDQGVLEYSASLLRMQDESFEVVGNATGTVTSASDFNADGQINLHDFSMMVACLSGPNAYLSETCRNIDLDLDGDADLADVALFEETHSARQ